MCLATPKAALGSVCLAVGSFIRISWCRKGCPSVCSRIPSNCVWPQPGLAVLPKIVDSRIRARVGLSVPRRVCVCVCLAAPKAALGSKGPAAGPRQDFSREFAKCFWRTVDLDLRGGASLAKFARLVLSLVPFRRCWATAAVSLAYCDAFCQISRLDQNMIPSDRFWGSVVRFRPVLSRPKSFCIARWRFYIWVPEPELV